MAVCYLFMNYLSISNRWFSNFILKHVTHVNTSVLLLQYYTHCDLHIIFLLQFTIKSKIKIFLIVMFNKFTNFRFSIVHPLFLNCTVKKMWIVLHYINIWYEIELWKIEKHLYNNVPFRRIITIFTRNGQAITKNMCVEFCSISYWFNFT